MAVYHMVPDGADYCTNHHTIRKAVLMFFRIIGYQYNETTGQTIRRVSDAMDNRSQADRTLQKGISKGMLEWGYIQVYTSAGNWIRARVQPELV